MLKSRFHIFATILAVVSIVHVATADAQDRSGRLTFDVAAIHPSNPNERSGGIKPLPGGNGYTVRNVPVKLMISLMYKVPMRQITGGPAWMDSDRFDIEAKSDAPYNVDDLHTMFQNLLADRFGLKFHKRIEEGNVYALSVDKSGLKMNPNASAQDFKIPVNPGPNGNYVGTRVPMPYLCWFLGQVLQWDERPVIDRTGLEGNYDFTLSFQPQLPPGSQNNLSPEMAERPSLFEALKSELGLKLEPTRGPIEFYVIDHIDKPSDN